MPVMWISFRQPGVEQAFELAMPAFQPAYRPPEIGFVPSNPAATWCNSQIGFVPPTLARTLPLPDWLRYVKPPTMGPGRPTRPPKHNE